MLIALALAAGLAAPLPELLVEGRLAEAASLAVGDTVQVRPRCGAGPARAFVVAGAFERAADPARISRNEFELRLHLADLEAMLPVRDRVDRCAVVLAPGTHPDSTARWIQGTA